MVRMNSWSILLTLLTVLSSFAQSLPSLSFQTAPRSLCLATVWHVTYTTSAPSCSLLSCCGLFFALDLKMVLYFQRANLFPQQPIKWGNLMQDLPKFFFLKVLHVCINMHVHFQTKHCIQRTTSHTPDTFLITGRVISALCLFKTIHFY